MSNEYKDWLYDRVWDLVLERGLLDEIIEMWPKEGTPQYVRGLKNGQKVKYYVNYDLERGFLFEHRELEAFE